MVGPSDGTRLFDVFRGPYFTLLAIGCPAPSLGPNVRVLAVDTLDGYDVESGHFVLIRPDGYIGAISSSLSTIVGYSGLEANDGSPPGQGLARNRL